MDFNTLYDERYKNLNDNQRKAVDTIDGPVMVVAGPGTGKTELLSMRAANILRKTDSLPENILCLTFTESGSIAMQKRLTEIIGKEAYNVSIFTFHAFGSDIMGRYREYFYRGAEFRPADNLNQRQIIISILDTLDYNDPLCAKMNGEYTAIRDILGAISELKKASITYSELVAILDANTKAYDVIEPLITKVFSAPRITKGTLDDLEALVEPIAAIDTPAPISGIESYATVFLRSLRRTIHEAREHPKITPPLTAWKNKWTTANANKQRILAASKYAKKMRSMNIVYREYTKMMEQAKLYDYDDMIMQVVHAIEEHPELRYDLQEKYHYIMVDEFQDTNMAQMRILHNLTNNPVVEDTPNILVVGDDDQAVYSFQGADVGNILNFKDTFKRTQLIPLTDNYRSTATILEPSRDVIVQGETRLETSIEGLSKTLTAHKTTANTSANLVELPRSSDEHFWITEDVKKQLAAGTPSSEIAIIGRKHAHLEALVPYFVEAGIPISYDKRDNVLEDVVVEQLIKLSRIIMSLYSSDLAKVNALLPELLSHPAWGVDPSVVWRISLEAYKSRREWLEIMGTVSETVPIAQWLITAARLVPYTPLERMLDYIIGSEPLPNSDDFVSPLKEYFFSAKAWQEKTGEYMSLLQNLTTLRTHLREHEPDTSTPRLDVFLHFIEELENSQTKVTSTRHIGEDTAAVRFMSAHSSKGLEFDSVYIINGTNSGWLKGGKSSSIVFPENMTIRAHTNTSDDFLRLFFVAMTRAKRSLTITYSLENERAAAETKLAFLTTTPHLTEVTPQIERTSEMELNAAKATWYAPIVELPTHTKREYLASILETYKISATAVNSFIDITNSGPELFLLNNLLHFPSARSIHAEFGDAIHQSLQYAHDHISAHGEKLPEEDIFHAFEENLRKRALTEQEFDTLLQRGSDALRAFLADKYSTFNTNQTAELPFRFQNVTIGDVSLTGKMDVVEIDKENKSIVVTDYKTGSPLSSWDKGADYEKIKAHKYRQQLLFYKLLVEHSRDYRNYTMREGILQFVEPDKKSQAITALTITDFSHDELERFTKLMSAIWQHIHELNFPDTSHYPQTLAGIQEFEQDLIDGKI